MLRTYLKAIVYLNNGTNNEKYCSAGPPLFLVHSLPSERSSTYRKITSIPIPLASIPSEPPESIQLLESTSFDAPPDLVILSPFRHSNAPSMCRFIHKMRTKLLPIVLEPNQHIDVANLSNIFYRHDRLMQLKLRVL
jgi:hypothetical protein